MIAIKNDIIKIFKVIKSIKVDSIKSKMVII